MTSLPRSIRYFLGLGMLTLAVAACSAGSGGVGAPPPAARANGPQPPLQTARITMTIPGPAPATAGRRPQHVSSAVNGVLVRVFPAGTTSTAAQRGYDVSGASSLCSPSGLGRTCTLSIGIPPGSYDFSVAAYTTPVAADGTLPSGAIVLDAGALMNQTAAGSSISLTIPLAIVNGSVSTIAGNGLGYVNATGSAARFNNPFALAVDGGGNLYVSDANNKAVRLVTPFGVVTTFAGGGSPIPSPGFTDGTGTGAQFNSPCGIAFDPSGNLYVADQTNHALRKITSAGVVTTFAGGAPSSPSPGFIDGTGTAARFNLPTGVAVDPAGNLYVADQSNHAIRKVTPAGVVTTFAGGAPSSPSPGFVDGTGNAARFNLPTALALDAAGNLYVADTGNTAIRKITPAGVVSTLAGTNSSGFADGAGSAARFTTPTGVAVDALGDVLVADRGNNAIRKITPTGMVTTVAGAPPPSPLSGFTDGIGSSARFFTPKGVAVDSGGNVYVTDAANAAIRVLK